MNVESPQVRDTPAPTALLFPRARDWWILAAVLGAIFVFCLGSRGLNDPDEGRYANIALAMAKTGGDWWEPRESGFGHYDKPPLVYWCTALSLRVFGFNEWAARVTPFFGAALSLAGLAWAAVRLYGARIAWWAVLICGTSVQFWVMGRVLSPDMLMTGWCTLGVAAWVECRRRNGAWEMWLATLACWTLAWWTKATPSLAPLAGVLIGTYATGDRAGRRALRAWLLVPAVLLLGSPWYLAMLGRYPELSDFFFQRELVNRVIGRVDGRHGSLIYYVPLSLVAWLPWWPVAAWKWGRTPVAQRFARWWQRIGVEGWIVVVGLVLFSLVNSKLPTYTLPLAPWVSLLIARVIRVDTQANPTPASLLPGGAFAVCVVVGAWLLPARIESQLGPNSSLRPVCEYLRSQGARDIESDHYWPDMEFYLQDARIRYVLRASANQKERPSDAGLVPDRFVDPADWLVRQSGPDLPPGERWLVRFRGQRDSPFDAMLPMGAERRTASIGEFDLYRVGPSPSVSRSAAR